MLKFINKLIYLIKIKKIKKLLYTKHTERKYNIQYQMIK